MSKKPLRSFTAKVVLLTLAPWCAGCATEIYFRSSTGAVGAAGTGRLEVRVFEDRSHEKQHLVSVRAVVTELYRLEAKAETLVREEKVAHWSDDDLAPGRYRLRVSRWIGEDGVIRALPDDQDETFVISANESMVADVVLKDARKAKIGAAIAGTVLVGVAIAANQTYQMDSGIKW